LTASCEMPEWPKRGENSDFWFVEAKDPKDGDAPRPSSPKSPMSVQFSGSSNPIKCCGGRSRSVAPSH
jgi:hypothetical protein